MAKIITVSRGIIWHPDPNKGSICLMQNPPYPQKKYGSDLWTLPGGKIEGEIDLGCLVEAAKREIRQEVGIEVDLTDLELRNSPLFAYVSIKGYNYFS